MIKPEMFLESLKGHGIEFFTGVPDSLLQGFLSCVQLQSHHIITANEGAAIGMATGYHLATGKIALVYLQNSGLGNIINPLTSLAAPEVYGIPMLLLIGWRGQPGTKDEPQHMKMGAVTCEILDALKIPWYLLSEKSEKKWQELLADAIQKTEIESSPVALIVESGFFENRMMPDENRYELSSAHVLKTIYDLLDKDDVIVCNTGKSGRMFYDINNKNKEKLKKYFMNVGAMGHASSIAAGMAAFGKDHVVLIDGDGSLLMHMGSLAVIGNISGNNFTYILLNNGSHQSVGAQPTIGFEVDFCSIARACGFETALRIENVQALKNWTDSYKKQKQFVEIRIHNQVPDELPRPSGSLKAAKEKLMKEIQAGK